MIRELQPPERDAWLQSIDGCVDRSRPLYDNPTIGSIFICGAMRGLDVPIRSLASLARRFCEGKFFVLYQNLERIDAVALLEISNADDSDQLTREVYAQFPHIFAGDLVVCWGSSERWYILFDAQISLGVLYVRNSADEAAARAAYSDGDKLFQMDEAFAECAAYEVQGMPDALRQTIPVRLFRSWCILDSRNL